MNYEQADKILILGIDGMDPRITKKYLDEGSLPNLAKLLKKGSANKNYEMIGGQPTVTPPMWTTLCTGANPYVHGITDFSRQNGTDLGSTTYNLDSRLCQAEQLWNVTVEAGLKTLVWNWPGASWPPTKDSDLLAVVDGTQPAGVNTGIAQTESELIVIADKNTPEVMFKNQGTTDIEVPCFIQGMEVEEHFDLSNAEAIHAKTNKEVVRNYEELFFDLSQVPLDLIFSPIKEATNWGFKVPEGAKEFTVLFSKGLIRRPALILKNSEGIYDKVQLYKNKKTDRPLAVLEHDVYTKDIIDESIVGDKKVLTNRNMRLLEISPDGDNLRLWVSPAMDFSNDTLWYPKSMLQDVVDHVGYPQPIATAGATSERTITKCLKASWDSAAEWNAGVLKYLARNRDFKVIFSQFHNVDLQGHFLVASLKNGAYGLSPETYQKLFRDVYLQTDYYIGELLPLLDEGWTILLVSDHGQTCPEHDRCTIGYGGAVNATHLRELGYTVLKKDENGNELREVDWSKTTAVNTRYGHIYINLKGRNPHGIVDPADKYELEEKIMTDLYGLRDPKTGHRICQLALRNRDAVLLGTGGPEAGDVIAWAAEGYTYDHADSISTIDGACDTSVRSVFVGAGKGFKENYLTNRVVHHIDIAPTVAVLLGVRMPNECEGAPIYQILNMK